MPREGVRSKNGFMEYGWGWRTDKWRVVSSREKERTRVIADRVKGGK